MEKADVKWLSLTADRFDRLFVVSRLDFSKIRKHREDVCDTFESCWKERVLEYIVTITNIVNHNILNSR